jgi:ubiquinone biosynthesis protein Coq4
MSLLFDQIFSSFRNFLELSSAPLAVRVDLEDSETNPTWTKKLLTFIDYGPNGKELFFKYQRVLSSDDGLYSNPHGSCDCNYCVKYFYHSSVTTPEKFYRSLPSAALVQVYLRNMLAKKLVPLTKEMCVDNADAIGHISALLSLPHAIYDDRQLSVFKSAVAGLEEIINDFSLPDGAPLTDDGTAAVHSDKKRKKALE